MDIFKTTRIECDCSSFDHSVRFNIDNELGHVYMDVPLKQWRPFYQRVWLAIKYIFGYTAKYGHYDTVILKQRDYDKIREILTESEEIIKKNV
jgi:hypothetical protein